MSFEIWAKEHQYMMATIRTFNSVLTMIFSGLVFMNVFNLL